jgi:UDP-glucose 4-epimerase
MDHPTDLSRSRSATSTPPAPIQTARLGEDHDPETHLVPIVLETTAGLRKAVTVFGMTTTRRTAVRQIATCAHVRAIDALNGIGPAKFYNLGSGTGFSVLEISKPPRMLPNADSKGNRTATPRRSVRSDC